MILQSGFFWQKLQFSFHVTVSRHGTSEWLAGEAKIH